MRLWLWIAWCLDPDRLYRLFGYASLALAAVLLIIAVSGLGTVYWTRWRIY